MSESAGADSSREKKLRTARELHEIILSNAIIHEWLSSRLPNAKLCRYSILFYLGTWSPAYRDPKKVLENGHQYFTLYNDLPRIARAHNLPFDDTRPDPEKNRTLASVEREGNIQHNLRENATIWFLTEKGEQFVEELLDNSFKSNPPNVGALLVLIDQLMSRLGQMRTEALKPSEPIRIASQSQDAIYVSITLRPSVQRFSTSRGLFMIGEPEHGIVRFFARYEARVSGYPTGIEVTEWIPEESIQEFIRNQDGTVTLNASVKKGFLDTIKNLKEREITSCVEDLRRRMPQGGRLSGFYRVQELTL